MNSTTAQAVEVLREARYKVRKDYPLMMRQYAFAVAALVSEFPDYIQAGCASLLGFESVDALRDWGHFQTPPKQEVLARLDEAIARGETEMKNEKGTK